MSLLNRLLVEVDRALKTLSVTPYSNRSYPGDQVNQKQQLSIHDKRHSAGLMRVNHCGEVCAQALYRAQALMARDHRVADTMHACAEEEVDHLAWCDQRLGELDGHKSYLNPFWYAGSFLLGCVAGVAGDAYSLGFIAETEKQVSSHLVSHLTHLSSQDQVSYAIIIQMQQDELVHEAKANEEGAKPLPRPLPQAMRLSSKLMTYLSYYI